MAAKTLHPLTDTLKGNKTKSASVEWAVPMADTFKVAKVALPAATELAHPQQGAKLFLMVDTSDNRMGVMLQQRAATVAP